MHPRTYPHTHTPPTHQPTHPPTHACTRTQVIPGLTREEEASVRDGTWRDTWRHLHQKNAQGPRATCGGHGAGGAGCSLDKGLGACKEVGLGEGEGETNRQRRKRRARERDAAQGCASSSSFPPPPSHPCSLSPTP
jgi:hypothetical protein